MGKRDSFGDGSEAFNELLGQMTKESDRAVIVLGAAVAHDLLKQALLKALVPHVPWKSGAPDPFLDNNGVFGTFSACIDLSHRLGMIGDDMYKDLHRLRELRNDCVRVPKTLT